MAIRLYTPNPLYTLHRGLHRSCESEHKASKITGSGNLINTLPPCTVFPTGSVQPCPRQNPHPGPSQLTNTHYSSNYALIIITLTLNCHHLKSLTENCPSIKNSPEMSHPYECWKNSNVTQMSLIKNISVTVLSLR